MIDQAIVHQGMVRHATMNCVLPRTLAQWGLTPNIAHTFVTYCFVAQVFPVWCDMIWNDRVQRRVVLHGATYVILVGSVGRCRCPTKAPAEDRKERQRKAVEEARAAYDSAVHRSAAALAKLEAYVKALPSNKTEAKAAAAAIQRRAAERIDEEAKDAEVDTVECPPSMQALRPASTGNAASGTYTACRAILFAPPAWTARAGTDGEVSPIRSVWGRRRKANVEVRRPTPRARPPQDKVPRRCRLTVAKRSAPGSPCKKLSIGAGPK